MSFLFKANGDSVPLFDVIYSIAITASLSPCRTRFLGVPCSFASVGSTLPTCAVPKFFPGASAPVWESGSILCRIGVYSDRVGGSSDISDFPLLQNSGVIFCNFPEPSECQVLFPEPEVDEFVVLGSGDEQKLVQLVW